MKKGIRWAAWPVLLALMMTLLPGCAAAEEAPALSFRMTATVVKTASDAGVFAVPDLNTPNLYRMTKNDSCVVTGESGRCYQVQHRGATVYIAKSRLTLSGEIAEGLREEKQDLRLEDPIPYLNSTNYLNVLGTIQLDEPVDSMFAFIWDVRQGKVEQAYLYGFETPTSLIDAPSMRRLLSLEGVTAGEKIFVLEAGRGGELTVLFRSPLYLRGRFKEVAHVTKKCKVSSENVLDYDAVELAWRPSQSRPSLTVDIPDTVSAAGMSLEWLTPPERFTVDLYGEKQTLLSSREYATGFYNDWVELSASVRRAVITPSGEKVAMSTLRVYEPGYPQELVQQWQPLPEKVDLMAVSAHQDDECLFFGGTVPYYSYTGKTVAMVYMTNCSRLRYREAMDGMWTAGLRYHPVFLGLKDILLDSVQVSRRVWEPSEPEKLLVRTIRRYRPDVLVTHDFQGEYGHPQHQLTASLLTEAAELAADPDFDPESAAQYGVWQVKKIYVHLYAENQITMDWSVPLDASGVVTPIFLATRAFDKHRSQQGYFTMEQHGTVYDNRKFGLYYTTVGPDVEKNDFFENIPQN